MLGEHWDRNRSHRWRRWRTRVRLWFLSPRHRRHLIILCSVFFFLLAVKLLRLYTSYRRRLAWKVPILPSELVEPFTTSLSRETQQLNAATPRGIVLPLFDDIALLGLSLVLELRRLHVTLPVEVPHCGDLALEVQRKMQEKDPFVRFYDVCELAASATMDGDERRKLFCVDLEHCHDKFRSFDIKVLAVVYSRFQEIMLLDADTLFFQSPMTLWETQKYKKTGTLFFNDRISYELSYLAKRSTSTEGKVDMKVGAIHRFLSDFDVTPYRSLAVVKGTERRPYLPRRLLGLDFGFQPSAFLTNSHVWSLRSGHQMDSSLMLWDKKRQARATAMLASFVSLNGLPTAPSYGDKELYWLACELAETDYAFSDVAVGAVGWELLTSDPHNDKVLCGDALQHYPVQLNLEADVELLYMNSDNILDWGQHSRQLYRTAARPAEFYPGSFTERKLLQTCPFDVTTMELAPLEATLLTQRWELYKVVSGWIGEPL